MEIEMSTNVDGILFDSQLMISNENDETKIVSFDDVLILGLKACGFSEEQAKLIAADYIKLNQLKQSVASSDSYIALRMREYSGLFEFVSPGNDVSLFIQAVLSMDDKKEHAAAILLFDI